MEDFDWDRFWRGFGNFVETWRPLLVVIATIVLALLANVVLRAIIRRAVDRIVRGAKRKSGSDDTQVIAASPLAAARLVQRTRALGSLLGNVVTATITIFAILTIVFTLLPDASGALSLITAAVGAGLGFGAQNIVKDILNGVFIVVEDQVGVGDVIDTGFATGVVENVGIRVTEVRDVNGTLWFVRNGEILRIGNMSQGWARVIIDLAVPYDSDVDAVQQRMLETAKALAGEIRWKPLIIETPELWGIESISAEALIVRIVVKTRPGDKDTVARELRVRLKRALDAMDVRLPSLNTVVLSGFEGATSVRGARTPKTQPVPTPVSAKPRRRITAPTDGDRHE